MDREIRNRQMKGYSLILIAGALWGTNGMFSSFLREYGAESAAIAFLRLALSVLLLVPIMLAAGGSRIFKIDRRGIAASLILGVFSQALFNFAYAEGIDHVGVATSSVLAYTSPVFVCIMARIFFKERITWVKVTALCINIVGCTLTVTGGDFSAVRFSVYGAAMSVLAGFLYALMTIITTLTGGRYNPLTIMFYSFIFGSVTLGLIGNPWGNIAQAFSLPLIVTALCYGLFATVGSYFVFMKGVSMDLETSKVPVVCSVETIVASVTGVFLFNENLGGMKLLGIALVLCSIAVMNLVQPKAPEEPSAEPSAETGATADASQSDQ